MDLIAQTLQLALWLSPALALAGIDETVEVFQIESEQPVATVVTIDAATAQSWGLVDAVSA